MIWQGTSLIDATSGQTLASATRDFITLELDGAPAQKLRITSDNPSLFQAESAGYTFRAGTGDYVLERSSFTTSLYVAHCAGRGYTLQRKSSGFVSARREINRADGTTVAVTRSLPNGDLEVITRCPLDMDIVFMTWALTFVDTPTRRTKF